MSYFIILYWTVNISDASKFRTALFPCEKIVRGKSDAAFRLKYLSHLLYKLFYWFYSRTLFWSEIKIVRTLLSYGTWYKVVMNILHNRFACLWRQDLSQNVTTKENWKKKKSCNSSLFFSLLVDHFAPSSVCTIS